ncbi:MAG: thioredoxin domain-containing protein [Steroidobacteraceae bacterium]
MRRLVAALLFLWTIPGYTAGSHAAKIDWQPWSDSVFERAARENRFVLLDLEAVWCHWCHVMDEVTYSDPKVVELIKSRYIPVRVDQDSRPDISRRYENYGWPATVVFNAEGGEIVKRRGYLAPPVMISMLEEIIVDPSPVNYGDNEPIAKFADNPLLSPKLRQSLERAFYETHDPRLGGQKQFQKFIDHDTTEYGLLRAGQGDKKAEEMTRRTLTAALKLVDPAWGGVYQYSTDSDWDHPHFEKIMAMQAEPLRLYALGYGQFRDERYLKAVRDIHRYVTTFLGSPEGAFYTSQDADLVKGEHSEKYFALDDAARRKLGIPAVDKHRYSRENGWMIQALATAYTVTCERVYLDDAQRAARWIVANRSLAGGGFRHDEKDVAGPYLEDTLAMGDAFLALYAATGEREWLARAAAGAGFIEQHFRGSQPGYLTSAARAGSPLQSKSNVDENIPLARFANLLHRYTGDARYRSMSDYALRMLVTEQVAGSLITAPGILLAAFESANDPLHITIVGGKNDAAAVALFDKAIRYAAVYRRIEWWDRREGNMPNPDVRYPQLSRAAAFICTDSTCSLPIFDASKITTEIARSVRQVAKN